MSEMPRYVPRSTKQKENLKENFTFTNNCFPIFFFSMRFLNGIRKLSPVNDKIKILSACLKNAIGNA